MVTILLAPSKTMDFISTPPYGVVPMQPLFLKQSARIASVMKQMEPEQLTKTMAISQPIAAAVHDYYGAWQTGKQGRPALWTYIGDVYKGVQAKTMSLDDAKWAQQHLVIASGLYGLVRPYDGIQAYRLEMKAAVSVDSFKNLSELWGDLLADYVDALPSDWLCNCSSDEYAKPVLRRLKKTVVTPIFYDTKPNGLVGPVPIYSKMMRGVLARWIIDNRISKADELHSFTAHDYRFDAKRSKPLQPAFSRTKMVPLKFT